jgi:cytochrome b561
MKDDFQRGSLSLLRNDTDSWGVPAQLFHWVMALLIFAQITLGLMAVSWRMSPTKLALFFWHKSTGMALLSLLVLRLAWRLVNRTPALPADMPGWERAAAHASHALLYALMIALPITGWVVQSAANIPFRIFYLVPLPAIVAPDKALSEAFALVHRGFSITFAAVLIVHIGAALRHHFVKRDQVLARMLPRRAS